MADWNNPLTTSNYATGVLQVLKDRDFDAISLCLSDPTNMVDGMLKLVRSPKIKFQERSSGAWVDRVLDLEAGGTGSATASGARNSLGLGTMATQNANAVAISGGSLAGTGAGITNLAAGNISSGGTLPPLVGTNLVGLDASNLSTGTIAPARMGSGATAAKFLRGDNTWQSVSVVDSVLHYNFSGSVVGGSGQIDLTVTTVANQNLANIIMDTQFGSAYGQVVWAFLNATTIRINVDPAQAGATLDIKLSIIQYS